MYDEVNEGFIVSTNFDDENVSVKIIRLRRLYVTVNMMMNMINKRQREDMRYLTLLTNKLTPTYVSRWRINK